MLDAGHAGSYFNASPVVQGYYESEQMWRLTQKLKTALEAYGFEVGLTRQDKNDDPELTERGRKARGYDFFISMHSNAANTEAPDAPWLIHYRSDNKTNIDEASEAVARALGPVISKVMGVSEPFCYTKGVDFDRDYNGYLDDEYYGVLFGAKSVGVPGIIIEHSFHTNRKAAEWLLDDKNLDRLAEAEAEALARYYGLEDKPMTKAEQKAFDELVEKVVKLERRIENVKPKYNWTKACPDWAQATVHKLLQKGYLKGDQNGQLGLSEDMCRMLVILDRAGAFKE
jgi:N-acetylmuramoyl-L-alanine amidase